MSRWRVAVLVALVTQNATACSAPPRSPAAPPLGSLPPVTIDSPCPKLSDVDEEPGTTKLEGRTVEKICFFGANAALERELRERLSEREGSKFVVADAERDLQKLLWSEHIDDGRVVAVPIGSDKLVLVVEVVPRLPVTSLRLPSGSPLTADALTTLFPFEPPELADPAAMARRLHDVEDAYAKLGYARAQARYRTTKTPAGVDVDLEVDPGPRGKPQP